MQISDGMTEIILSQNQEGTSTYSNSSSPSSPFLHILAMASQEILSFRKEIHTIRYKRFRWVQLVSTEMLADLEDTETAYHDWLSRVRSRCTSLARDGLTGATEELQGLLDDHSDFDPAIFETKILAGKHQLQFQLSGHPATQSGLPQQQVLARVSRHSRYNVRESLTSTKFNLASTLNMSDAINQKLWITWARWGCFCISCPCPPIAVPSLDTDATYCLAPRHFHTDPLEQNHAQEHFKTVHGVSLDQMSLIKRYGTMGMC
jgi:hypothetical protein